MQLGGAMSRFISIALLLAALTGCSKLVESDFEGEWTLRESSRDNLPTTAANASPELSLLVDRTFSISDAPMTLYMGADVAPTAKTWLLSGSGTWRLTANEGHEIIELSFKSIRDGLGGRFPFQTYSIPLQAGKQEIYYFEGDPDNYKRIVFERKSK